MAEPQASELVRLNAQIVGHLLAQRSPPRELIARREMLRAALQSPDGGDRQQRVKRRRYLLAFWG